MWPASKITMTPSDTINAGCSGPGWREAFWWRPLVMNPVKSHSWSLVFWSWKLRPLLCASAIEKLIHHGCATRLFRRGPMKMKDFKMLQVFFFCGRILKKPCLVLEKNNARISPTSSAGSSGGVHGTCNRIAASPHQLTRRPRHGAWHETVTWYRWNPNCSKPIWVCLKCWVYSQWNSHLIMISKTIGFRGTLFSDTPILTWRKNNKDMLNHGETSEHELLPLGFTMFYLQSHPFSAKIRGMFEQSILGGCCHAAWAA